MRLPSAGHYVLHQVHSGHRWLAEKRGQVNLVAEELGGGGGVQVGVVCLVPHPGVHHRRCGPIQLLDLCFVSVDEELVEVVLGGGLVVVPHVGVLGGGDLSAVCLV